jgi:hypothetical protein
MASTLTADQHKLMGNEHFKLKEFEEAIAEYSTAIVCLALHLSDDIWSIYQLDPDRFVL